MGAQGAGGQLVSWLCVAGGWWAIEEVYVVSGLPTLGITTAAGEQQ